MTGAMIERDGVMAAVRGLTEDALAGRGGALFADPKFDPRAN